ncbi:MAG: mitochondrial fusion and transport protein ugo1 [Sclerophora amabilis]|nr:MAG: mitochondrial fusion and transport protein ugo1 [Sclerophora amabilis]
MSSSREGPNPLRPYYVPHSPNLSSEIPTSSNSTGSAGFSGKNGPSPASKPSFSSARDIFSDLDYSDYLSDSSPSAVDIIKGVLDQALWKYTSVLLAQPFEVAKTVLQCHVASAFEEAKAASEKRKLRQDYHRDRSYDTLPDEDHSSDDDDESAYFTSSAPHAYSRNTRSDVYSRSSHRPRSSHASSSTSQPAEPSSLNKLHLQQPPSLLDVISQLWRKEGAWGVWKGANTTFIYSVLFKTIEIWTRGFLAALANIPDPGILPAVGVSGVDIADSPYPWASLGVIVSAAGFAGVLLAPLDIIRTRLPPLLTTSVPLFLRSRLAIDPILTPTAYGVFRFLTATGELFLRLPLETVLRRAQVHIGSAEFESGKAQKPSAEGWLENGVIDVGAYKGMLGTMWYIVREEGSRGSDGQALIKNAAAGTPLGKEKQQKGQGIEGLCRGWRVGMWGLGGMWAAAILGGAAGVGSGGEF